MTADRKEKGAARTDEAAPFLLACEDMRADKRMQPVHLTNKLKNRTQKNYASELRFRQPFALSTKVVGTVGRLEQPGKCELEPGDQI